MAKRKSRVNWKSRLKRLAPVELIIALAAFIPYTRHGREMNHGFFASFLFDQPGYLLSSLVNLVLFNVIFAAIVFVAMRLKRK